MDLFFLWIAHYGKIEFSLLGEFDICSICFWVDGSFPFMDPDSDGGANNLLLQEAQRNCIRLGACGSW
ncbi:CPCC family cysteine-rich protein [Brevibacillus sp. Leaf182]|uniref:CPCC family cysteine-rich protein n=1 Tax=Brevibacillus sp. Leaf182 TaxID=1736290 RepID=UPI00351A8BAC